MKIAKTKHGGLVGGEDRAYSSGPGYDLLGLVRVAGDQGRWPHTLAMGRPIDMDTPAGRACGRLRP
jgi:hypothetical protein